MRCGVLMTSALIGNCTNHPYPDYWYPEFDNGRPSNTKMEALVNSIKIAKEECSTCPVAQDCLKQGMEPNDLPFGIWGGKLAGERIESLGYTRDDFALQTDEGRALDFYERMKPRLG